MFAGKTHYTIGKTCFSQKNCKNLQNGQNSSMFISLSNLTKIILFVEMLKFLDMTLKHSEIFYFRYGIFKINLLFDRYVLKPPLHYGNYWYPHTSMGTKLNVIMNFFDNHWYICGNIENKDLEA